MVSEKGAAVRVLDQVKIVPVVQACAPEMSLIKREAQRMHENQSAAGGAAGAADVSGVLRYFRFDEDNVEHELILCPSGRLVKMGFHQIDSHML